LSNNLIEQEGSRFNELDTARALLTVFSVGLPE